jgi:Tol biopolymer transport system component
VTVIATALLLCVAMASASSGLAAQNGVIVFQRGVQHGGHFVSVSDTGQGLRSIGPSPASEISPGNQGAAFSSDGQKILFVATTGINSGSLGSGIFTIGVDGGGLSPVLSSPGQSSTDPSALTFNSPSYFPNGQEIVFAAVEGFGSEYRIYAMRLDGSDRRQLTSGYEDYEPLVSPDGAEVAFDRIRNRRSAIYTMSSAGSTPRRISASGCDASLGGFSPDGRRLVFVQSCGHNSAALFTMAPDGSHPRRLTRSRPGTFDTNPTFSPDGQSIAFLRSLTANHRRPQLYTMKANGSRIRYIAARASAPIWQPIP